LVRVCLVYCFYQGAEAGYPVKFLLHMGYNALLTVPIYLWHYHAHYYGWLKKKTENGANG
jgi:hypothetical protein